MEWKAPLERTVHPFNTSELSCEDAIPIRTVSGGHTDLDETAVERPFAPIESSSESLSGLLDALPVWNYFRHLFERRYQLSGVVFLVQTGPDTPWRGVQNPDLTQTRKH